MQVRTSSAQPPAAADGPVERAEPFLPVAVHVFGEPMARLLHSEEERGEERVRRRSALEHERPVAAAIVVGACRAGLHALEVREAVRVVPARHSRVGSPALVVERVTPLEDHPVDRARAAEHPATGVVDAPAFHVRFGLRLVLPVVEAIPDRERQRCGHVDVDVPRVVGTSGLEHEHARRRVRAQAVRERAAGRPTADDHVVVPALAHDTTTVWSSVNDSIGAAPPTRPIPLAVPERPPNGRCPSQ